MRNLATRTRRNLIRSIKDKLFFALSFSSIFIALAFLAFFLVAVIYLARGVVYQTTLQVPITHWHFESGYDDNGTPYKTETVDSFATLEQALIDTLPPRMQQALEDEELYPADLVTSAAPIIINRQARTSASSVQAGASITFTFPLAAAAQAFLRKGDQESDLFPLEKEVLLHWSASGAVQETLNTSFLTSLDSKSPEIAGLYGALLGSVIMLIVAFLISFPIGLGAAVYFNELAPKNKITDYLIININNLAAVPSIIYGVLGLTIFIHYFGIPRASALVGGFVLSLMIIPMVIVSGMAALATIPRVIDEGALGLGATKIQTILHHKIPLALPGMLTGSIIGVARALGESAPLLMIGMLAFIANEPNSLADPITALPIIIYIWSQQPEPFFAQKASAAIVVLLAVLVFLNLAAILLRQKFQKQY